MSTGTRERIETLLRQHFDPPHLEVRDDSASHAGHPGSTSGGGHFEVLIVATRFEGLPLLERHRLVNETLRDLFGGAVHALALKTVAPSEWPGPEPAGRERR